MSKPRKKAKTGLVYDGVLPIRIFKIGSDDRPAGPKDIKDFQKMLKEVDKDPTRSIVTHHLVTSEVVGLQDASLWLQLFDRGIVTKETLKKKLGLESCP
jgi:hypothetical protein